MHTLAHTHTLTSTLPHAVVVNSTGKMEQCVAQMSCIIDAEKSRTSNRYSTAATVLPAANSQPSA